MPIYEYQCQKCGSFEVTQRITDEPLKRCPSCRRKVTKLISQTSFQLKGTGWYVTDYASKGNGDGASGEGASTGNDKDSAKAETGKKAKTESKPADKKSKAAADSAA